MADRFNLTAVLQLQAPTNTAQVISQVQRELGKLGINLKINANTKSLAAVQGQLKSVDKSARTAGKGMGLLGRNISEAARRFSVITIATGSFIALARSIKQSVGAAISFQREMIKIAQVTGGNITTLKSLSGEVTHLSTSLGVANQSLLETSRILAQAGFSALKTKQALEILANTTLAPSFDNIIDTTEGAIAIINQFGREAKKTGGEIQFLENALDAINQVSKTFAVESKDLITAVRRTGGVFEAAGGKLNELIALFTSVRQTTRESAETIATGFRTIFTRLQRSETIDELNKLGIALNDVEGKFIGPMRAIEALAAGLAGMDPRDVRFNEIVEQLGGFRQIGKVIPLIKQYAVATEALSVANNSAGSTSKDAQTAQQALAVQFQKVIQQFDALIRKFSESDAFTGMASTILKLAETFLKFAESLEKVLPLLAGVAAIKIGRSLAPGLAGMFGGGGGRGRQYGGVIRGFSGGGFVPGEGNRDTVPAMLQPGEFVVKKSSAKKLGANQLTSMNRYGNGGDVKKKKAPKLVAAGASLQASHIGDDLELTDPMIQTAINNASIKFKRAFVANAIWKPAPPPGSLNPEQLEALQDNEIVSKQFNLAKAGTGMTADIRNNMGLTAKTPIKLNFPSTYNQALRRTDVDLVDRGEMSAWTKRTKDLFHEGTPPGAKKKKPALPAGMIAELKKQGALSVVKNSIASKIGSMSGSAEGHGGPNTAFDDDSELVELKAHLQTTLGGVSGKMSGMVNDLFGKADFIFKGSGWKTKYPILKKDGIEAWKKAKGAKRTGQDRDENVQLRLGGLIQRFALGGIAKVNKIGAAILDRDMGMATEGISVGIKDVQAAIKGSGSEPSLVKKNLGPMGVYTGKTYNLSRQGLNKKTSDGFKQQIVEGLGVGLDHATSTLGADLGLGVSKMDSGSRQEFQNYISKRPVVGDLFESALQSLGTSGKFTEAAVSAPFDFPGGLSGKLKDNYSNLPKNWIDAKSSYGAASTGNMKGKIVSELVAELHSTGEYARLAKPSKKVAAEAAAVAGAKQAAKGGSISGTDSVPALLTPGEFVVKKSSAQNIGYSKLRSMNESGVARFADGGKVQRFATGGTIEGISSDVTKGMKAKDIAFANRAAKANAVAWNQLTEDIKTLDPDEAKASIVYFARNFDTAGDDAALLHGSMVAARRSMTKRGPSGTRTPPMDADPGLSESRDKFSPSGDQMAEMARSADALAQEFSFLGEETRAGQHAQKAYRQAVMDGATEAEAMSEAWHTGSQFQTKMAAEMDKLLTEYREGKISEDELQEATDKLAKQRAASKTGPSAGPIEAELVEQTAAAPKAKGPGLGSKVMTGLEKTFKGVSKTARAMSTALSRVSSALLGLTFIAGTLVQASSQLSDAEKEQVQAGLNQVAAYGAVAAEVASFGLEIVAGIAATLAWVAMKSIEMATMAPSIAAKVAETAASFFSAGADAIEAVASGTSAVADLAEAGSSGVAAGADIAEAASSGVAGIAGLALAAVFAMLIVAVLAVIAVFAAIGAAWVGGFGMSIYQTAVAVKKLEQSIEAFRKVSEKELDTLEETGGGSEKAFVDALGSAAGAELESRIAEATQFERASERGDAVAGRVSAEAMPSSWGEIGLAVLSPVAGLIEAAADAMAETWDGLVDEFENGEEHVQRYIDQHQDAVKIIREASKQYATSIWRNVKVLKEFEQALKLAKDAGLNAGETLDVMNSQTGGIITQFQDSQQALAAGDETFADLTQMLKNKGIITAGGEEVGGAASDAGLERDLAQWKELNAQRNKHLQTQNKALQHAVALQGKLRAQLQQTFGELIAVISGAAEGASDMPGLEEITTFDELLSASEEIGDRWKDSIENVKKLIDLEYAARIAAAVEAGEADLAARLKLLKDLKKREMEAAAQEAAMARLVAEQKAIQAILSTELAERAKLRAINDVNNALRAFNEVLFGATNTAKAFAMIDPGMALANLEGPDAALFDTRALETPLREINFDTLSAALEQGAATITQGADAVGDALDKSIHKSANDMVRRIETIHQVVNKMQDVWGKAGQLAKKPPINTKDQTKFAKDTFDQLNSAVGGALGTFELPGDVGLVIRDAIQKRIDAGEPINVEFMEELTSTLEGMSDKQKAAFLRSFELQNEYLTKLHQVNNAIIDVQNEFVDALSNVVDVQEKAADRMAKAVGRRRGGDFDRPANERRGFRERERGRRVAAGIRLGGRARGQGAVAGSVGATSAALTRLKDAADAATRAARDEGDADEKGRLAKLASENANAAKKATEELKRLADQSARAADIEGELNKVRKKRTQVSGVLEDLAFGTDEARVDLSSQFRDVVTAINQGNMAGATGEQRGGIKTVLDKLSEIEIGGTGMIGREIKAVLAQREALAMGFPPELARSLGDAIIAGSREEMLLDELRRIGEEEVRAAQALAQHAQEQVNYLEQIRNYLTANFRKDIEQANRDANVQTPERAKVEADLKAAYEAITDALDKTVPALDKLRVELKKLREQIRDVEVRITLNVEAPVDPNAAPHHGQPPPAAPGAPAQPDFGGGLNASGGLIYRAEGGSIFQPRGTDTVPAMLTPGEFVIRKSAVDKIGAGNLAALNKGIYRAEGGPVGLPDPGDITTAFAEALTSGSSKNATRNLHRAIMEGFGLNAREASRIVRQLKQFKDAGRLSVSDFAGPEELEGLIDVIRQSKYLKHTGIGPENVGIHTPPLELEEMLKDPEHSNTNLPKQIASKESFNAAQKALGVVEGYATDLSESGKLMDQAIGAGETQVSANAVLFAKALSGTDFDAWSIIGAYSQRAGWAKGIADSVGPKLKIAMTPGQTAEEMEKAGKANTVEGQRLIDIMQRQRAEAETETSGSTRGRKDAFGNPIGVGPGAYSGGVSDQAAKEEVGEVEPHFPSRPTAVYGKDYPVGEQEKQTWETVAEAQLKHQQRQWWMLKNQLLGFSDLGTTRNQMITEQVEEIKKEERREDFVKSANKGKGAKTPWERRKAEHQADAWTELVNMGLLRMQGGGNVRSVSDTIPAMLTPGEYVMSPEAVRHHGVGFMKQLNRGETPGFRQGGIVGKGVAYRRGGSRRGESGGGMLALDTSNIQGVLDNFNAQFTANLDLMVSSLSLNTTAMTDLAGAFGNMTITMMWAGSLDLNVNIGNTQAIKDAVRDGIEPNIKRLVEETVSKKINEANNSPTGQSQAGP